MNQPAELLLAPRETWQEQLQNAIRRPEDLADVLGIPRDRLPYAAQADRDFPLLVPRAFVQRMRRGDPADPLLVQVLATREELDTAPGFSRDPVAEQSRYAQQQGLIQKYTGRALLILTGSCAVNCRYCFRRHYPYGDNALSSAERRARVDALLQDPSIGEIILSGGDPLLLGDGGLASISDQIAASRRRVTLRIHTRLPVVIPDRVTASLLQALTRPGMPVVVVLHSNHPAEIDAATAAAIGALRAAGHTVLNQSVLLKGVNDDAQTLGELSDRLFAAGALPYYLHMLDKVAGAAHFDVTEERARRLLGELAACRPGYLVPRLAVEVPGASSKRELAPIYEHGDGAMLV